MAVLPLKEELREKFDLEKALQYFYNLEGTPYGFHNFVFGWIDTENESVPPALDIEFIYVVFNILEKISRYTTDRLLGEALNKRLGTEGLSLD